MKVSHVEIISDGQEKSLADDDKGLPNIITAETASTVKQCISPIPLHLRRRQNRHHEPVPAIILAVTVIIIALFCHAVDFIQLKYVHHFNILPLNV